MRCSDGRNRWGVFGAAGVVFVHRPTAQTATVMLQKRSVWSHEGGTWSCAGGALDEDESAYDGALREAEEEVGLAPFNHVVLGEYVFTPATDWSYTTVVVEVKERFGASMNFETDAVKWVPIPEVDDLPLHAGFAAAWPFVRDIALGVEDTAG
jgi:8-oxo-dGTP diphosphatase